MRLTRPGLNPLRNSSSPVRNPRDISVPPPSRIFSIWRFSSAVPVTGWLGATTLTLSSKTTTETTSCGPIRSIASLAASLRLVSLFPLMEPL